VVDYFATNTGLTPAATARFRRRLYGRFASLAPYLNGGPAADLPGTELLLVHDRSDRQAPFAVSEWFATRRPGTRLLEVSGLGHQRLLREAQVIDEVVGFVRERTGELRRAG
jgi:hypothetical protein